MGRASLAGGSYLTNIRAIVFDAVGTLLQPAPAAAEVYAEVGRQHGSRLTSAEIARRFRASFEQEEARDREQGWRTSEERERLRWQGIVAAVLDDVADPDACFAKLYTHFSRPQAWVCAADAAPTLKTLAGLGYMLGLASNYDGRLRPVVEGLPPLDPLSHLVISSEVGWRKPAPQFFAELQRILGLPASEILYIGDDRVNDYDGAARAGLQALLFDPRGKEVCSAVTRIARLGDLLTDGA